MKKKIKMEIIIHKNPLSKTIRFPHVINKCSPDHQNLPTGINVQCFCASLTFLITWFPTSNRFFDRDRSFFEVSNKWQTFRKLLNRSPQLNVKMPSGERDWRRIFLEIPLAGLTLVRPSVHTQTSLKSSDTRHPFESHLPAFRFHITAHAH